MPVYQEAPKSGKSCICMDLVKPTKVTIGVLCLSDNDALAMSSGSSSHEDSIDGTNSVVFGSSSMNYTHAHTFLYTHIYIYIYIYYICVFEGSISFISAQLAGAEEFAFL